MKNQNPAMTFPERTYDIGRDLDALQHFAFNKDIDVPELAAALVRLLSIVGQIQEKQTELERDLREMRDEAGASAVTVRRLMAAIKEAKP